MTNDNPAKPGTSVRSTNFERRKEFCRLTDADSALLTELREVFSRHSDEVVDRFYSHMQGFDELRPLLSDDKSVEQLKGFQRRYLASLASGEYGEEYAQDRRRIGQAHSQIGLDPEWYLGAYGLYLDLLFPLIHERYGDDLRGAVRSSAALAKLMILDMQLVLDAYYGIRQKRAVERSEQLAAVGELAASIAHEVRNPLAGMKGAMEVLRKGLDESNREVADELMAQVDRLEGLVRDLLTYARPRALNRQPFDLHDMLDRLLRRYQEQCESQNVTVHRVYEPGTGRLFADSRQMEQVFLNLIHNALQAMPDGGKLRVVTHVDDRAIEIKFVDDGNGIPETDMPKVQQPFFTTKHRGSGLGLPIVKKIAEAHNGRLELASEPGRGTSAIVVIPKAASD
jgi:signal transduction histidine kinase